MKEAKLGKLGEKGFKTKTKCGKCGTYLERCLGCILYCPKCKIEINFGTGVY